MGLSGRPPQLIRRVREGCVPSPEEFRHSYILTENRLWSVPVTLVEARGGDAGVSGRVREGVLASSEVIGATRPFWVIEK